MKITNILRVGFAVVAMASMASCSSMSRVAYMQDTPSEGVMEVSVKPAKITVQPKDEISIIVNCQDQELAQLFNLPYAGQRIGVHSTQNGNFTQGVVGYFVDSEGNIDFPVIGTIHVAGLTREQVATTVKELLKANNLLQDAIVTVQFMNLAVSVLGEVTLPGRYFIDTEELTILDALSKAGDMTIFGVREKVLVIRNDNGVEKTYVVDMTSSQSLFSSPVFYLRQNDVVYVQPNSKKAGESTVNGNNVRNASFWISISSLAASVATVVINAVR